MSLKVSASDSSARPSFPYPLPSPPAHSRPSRSLRSPATLSSLASHLLTLYPRLQSSSQRPPRADTEACPYNSPLPTPYYLLPTTYSPLPTTYSPVTLSSRLFSLDSCLSFPISALQPTPSAVRHRGLPLQLPAPYSLFPTTYSPLPTTYPLFTSHPLFSSLFS